MKQKPQPPRRKAGIARCLNPLSVGLFFTACALFSFSLVFYILSIFPFF